jgi:hypothetical protein
LREFSDLRAISMTNNEGRRPASSIGARAPRVAVPCSLNPGQNKMSKQSRRETKNHGRIRHGVARAIENLRGLRLPLVPRPEPGECLLLWL